MTAFATAMAAIVADPNLGVPAVYRHGGVGTGVAIRVVRSAADETFDAFGTTLVRPTDVLLVAASDVPAPAKGDVVLVVGETLTVLAAIRDPVGAAHRLLCAR
ncbi:MAG: hypothetical protein IT555_18425 [Acetobacteraceae bacterium]|nr:hypothetical protein [Acetobacteraceae bacterium]